MSIFNELRGRHTSPATAIAFSPDGKYIVSASSLGAAAVWETETGDMLWPLENAQLGLPPSDSKPGRVAAFTPDGKEVLLSKGTWVQIYDFKTGSKTGTLADIYEVSALAVSADGRRALVGWGKGIIRLLDLEKRKKLRKLGGLFGNGHNREVRGLVFSHDGRHAMSSDEGDRIIIWDLEQGKNILEMKKPWGFGRAVAFTNNGQGLAVANDKVTIYYFELKSGKILREIVTHPENTRKSSLLVPKTIFSPTLEWVAIYLRDSIEVRHVDGGVRIAGFKVDYNWGAPTAFAFSPNGETLAAGFHDGRIRLFPV